jgi:hypothetical protein
MKRVFEMESNFKVMGCYSDYSAKKGRGIVGLGLLMDSGFHGESVILPNYAIWCWIP